MNLRFHRDDSGDPHIWEHNVSETEVAEALYRPLYSRRGRGTSIIAIGQTRAGRYLKIIYFAGRRWSRYLCNKSVRSATQADSCAQTPPKAEIDMEPSQNKRKVSKKDPDRYPKGLNRKKVQELIDYYEKQSDEEAIAEMEAAPDANFTVMAVPLELRRRSNG